MTPIVIIKCQYCKLKFVFQGTIEEAEDTARASGWTISDGKADCGCMTKKAY